MLADLKLAFRIILKSPGFAIVVIFTLALGIGANTAIFSFFNAILLRPLPYAEPDRTVLVKDRPRHFGEIVGSGIGILSEDFRDLRKQTRSFQELATMTLDAATLTGRERTDLVFGAIASPNLFSVLGAQAYIGRVFTTADQLSGAGRLAVLSHRYWQNSLGGDRSIIGQSIILNNVSFNVVGIMPPDFDFPGQVNYWVTPANDVPESRIGITPGFERGGVDNLGRGNRLRTIVARLKPGVPIAVAEKELVSLAQGLPNPALIKRSINLVTLRDQTVGDTRLTMVVLLGCVGIVLLIACVNVANLMLSRATSRQPEMAIRLALGSSRWLIVRQLVIESVVLSLLGGILGVVASGWGLHFLISVAPEKLPQLSSVAINGDVLGFALAISLLTGLACGIVPVLAMPRTDLVSATKTQTRTGAATRSSRRLQTILVTGEVAISLVLLIAAGLLLRSFWQMQNFSWGFKPEQVITARVGFTSGRYQDPNVQRLTYRMLLDKLALQPGFESVSGSFDRIGFTWIHLHFMPEGHVYPTPQDAPEGRYRIISPGYFRTLGISLLQGRDFTLADNEKSAPVVIIDAELAKRFFPDGQAVGKRLKLELGEHPWAEVIGVTAAIKSDGPDQTVRPDLYLSFPQFPMDSLFVQFRSSLGLATAETALREAVANIDSGISIVDLASMDAVVARPANARRFSLGLLSSFAGGALVLAAIGIYAVTAYGVAQRKREMGLRMALGAQPQEIVRLVIWQSLRPVVVGVFVGFIASIVLAIAMRSLLFGIAALDVQTFILVPLPLVAFAFFACWVPARQAAQVNPMIALRAE